MAIIASVTSIVSIRKVVGDIILSLIEIGNVGDDKLVLTYNKALDTGSTPATGDFSLSGTTRTVSSVAVSLVAVTLTLSGDVSESDNVLLSYTAGANPIRDVSETNAGNLVNQAVTNNIGTYLQDHDGNYILDHDGNKIPI